MCLSFTANARGRTVEVPGEGAGRHRGNPIQRDALDEEADELERLARGLRRRDQDVLDALLDDATGYRDALHTANPTNPWITVLVCLPQQRVLVASGGGAAMSGDGINGGARFQ